jgi:hypothetical protein
MGMQYTNSSCNANCQESRIQNLYWSNWLNVVWMTYSDQSIPWPINARSWQILCWDVSKIGTFISPIINVVRVVQEHLMAHWWKAFFDGLCQKVAPWHQIWAQIHTVSRCDTEFVAARLCHIPLISPMNGVRVTQEHLVAYWCQAMAHFELGCGKNYHLDTKSGPKLTLFQGVTKYMLLPDYFISLTYFQLMVLGWPKSILWPISFRRWHILSCSLSQKCAPWHQIWAQIHTVSRFDMTPYLLLWDYFIPLTYFQ